MGFNFRQQWKKLGLQSVASGQVSYSLKKNKYCFPNNCCYQKHIEDVEPIEQPSSTVEQAANFTYEIPGGEDYMPLHPSRRSWEISREHVEVIKVIGKGAFSDVAKATLRNMRDNKEIITVAAKMLKGEAVVLDLSL